MCFSLVSSYVSFAFASPEPKTVMSPSLRCCGFSAKKRRHSALDNALVSITNTVAREERRSKAQQKRARFDSLHERSSEVLEAQSRGVFRDLDHSLSHLLKHLPGSATLAGDQRYKSGRKKRVSNLKNKCYLYAAFVLYDKTTLERISYHPVTTPYFSCKHTIDVKLKDKKRSQVSIQGLSCSLRGKQGQKNPCAMQHNHSERAFFSALVEESDLENLLKKSGLDPRVITEDHIIGIYLYNRWSSCKTCNAFLDGSLCDAVQVAFERITQVKNPIYLAHKGKFHCSDKSDLSETVAETRFSSDFYSREDKKPSCASSNIFASVCD